MPDTNRVVKYGEFELDFNSLPEASLMAMLRRGVSHFFGSEQASKVTAYFDPDKDEPVEDTPEARAKAKAEFQQKAFDALKAGTVGVSVRGPAVDPIQTIINRLAKAEIVNLLKVNGVKPPAKADATITTPDGATYTMAQLIARRLDPSIPSGVDKKTGVPHVDRLTKDAKKIADEQARKAKKAQDVAAEEGIAGL